MYENDTKKNLETGRQDDAPEATEVPVIVDRDVESLESYDQSSINLESSIPKNQSSQDGWQEGQQKPRVVRDENKHNRNENLHANKRPAPGYEQRSLHSKDREPVKQPTDQNSDHGERGPQNSQRNSEQRPRDRDVRDRNRDVHSQHYSRSLEEYSLPDLNIYARKFGIMGAGLMSKEQLLSRIRYVEANPDVEMYVEGVLEKLPDGFGFLRSASYDYVAGPDDVYVSPSQIRRFGLRTGDTIRGVIRKPKEGEKYFALLKVDTVNGLTPAQAYDRPTFDRLTPMHPNRKFVLEYEPGAIATRIMDLFTPIGRGQRGLIVAPPKVGKTLLLKEITQSLMASYPDAKLIVLLIDERPEEVADMRRTVRGTTAQVISSTFDEPASRHTQVAEVVLEQSKRLVESGKDVIIVLDSLTRLARAYNTNAPASGKVLTGGIDAHALQWPKRFFGAARCTEEGGSLTIIASALVETGSRMDEVIYEEFKGTGNMEIHMTRKLSNRRTYPAFELSLSGTRRDDLLLTEEEQNKVWMMQKLLSTMNTVDGMEFLIDKMKKFKTNREFLDSINKKVADKPGAGGTTMPAA